MANEKPLSKDYLLTQLKNLDKDILENKYAKNSALTEHTDDSDIHVTIEDKAKLHEHDNKEVLDGITSEKIADWDNIQNNASYNLNDKVQKGYNTWWTASNKIDCLKGGDTISVNTNIGHMTMYIIYNGSESDNFKIGTEGNSVVYTIPSDKTFEYFQIGLNTYAENAYIDKDAYIMIAKSDKNLPYVEYRGKSNTVLTDENIQQSNEIDEIKDELNEYKKRVNASPYVRLDTKPGYLRLYNKPNKICVIGNSITAHGYREADGIEWTVGDMREMAATYPNSGWVSLIQQYITQNLNPDCKVYKANGSSWEVGANGSRTYDLMKDAKSYEVRSDNSYEYGTIDSMLTEDTDVIIIQLSENMPEPTTDEARRNFGKDFGKLFEVLREKCPHAIIYQYVATVWNNANKMKVISSHMITYNIIPIFCSATFTTINPGNPSSTFAQSYVGAPIYDGEGQQIATVSNAVASHPGDKGFLMMAMQTLDAMFNYVNDGDVSVNRVSYYPASDATINNPYYYTYFITKNIPNLGAVTIDNFNETYSGVFDLFLLSGQYLIDMSFSNNQEHTLMQVTKRDSGGKGYNAIEQKLIPLNQFSANNSIAYVKRSVLLSDSNTTFTDFRFILSTKNSELIGHIPSNEKIDGKTIYTTYIKISNELKLSNTAWTAVGTLAKVPSYVLDAYYIVPTIRDTDVLGKRKARTLLSNINPSVALASETDGEITIPAGAILAVTYC